MVRGELWYFKESNTYAFRSANYSYYFLYVNGGGYRLTETIPTVRIAAKELGEWR